MEARGLGTQVPSTVQAKWGSSLSREGGGEGAPGPGRGDKEGAHTFNSGPEPQHTWP